MRRLFFAASLVAAALSLGGLAACRHAHAALAPGAPAGTGGGAAVLRARRGTLEPRVLLTGELKAAHAEQLVTPSTPAFEVQISWLAEDGSRVAAGQPVAQFDNSTFASQIEEKRSAVTTAEADLAQKTADGRAQLTDKAYSVDEKTRDLAKARLEASVPAELLPAHDYQDRQLKMQTAEAELTKAQEDLAAARRTTAADVAVQRVTLAKARRELAAAEHGLGGMTLRAPRAGTLVIADQPFEGRKLQVGDKLYPGLEVATLPDLASLEVEAQLSDVDDGQVKPGMAATCYLDAFPDVPHAGTVTSVAEVARESGRTAMLRYLPVRIHLAPWSAADLAHLRSGMSVRAEIAAAPVRDAVLVPRAALDFGGASSPAGPLRQDGAAARVLLAGGGSAPVRLGACDPFWCVALSGVAPGERLRRRGVFEGGEGGEGDDGGAGAAGGESGTPGAGAR